MPIETVNPTTGEIIYSYEEMTLNTVNSIIESTHTAFLHWREISIAQRAKSMQKIATLLLERKALYATLIANEMGKPCTQGEKEIEKCALVCEYYAANAAQYLEARIIKTEMAKSFVSYQPLGVIFAVMPWNFPFWQVFRFAAPTIMAGNAVLLKHASISTGTALAIEQLFADAEFPSDLFRTLVISQEMTQQVIANHHVMAVTLTGSTIAGSVIGAQAAKYLKKAVLELGGCDPYIILEDANLNNAAKECIASRMNNAGQSCIAAKRLITVPAIHAAFLNVLQEELKKYQTGDPLLKTTQCGPLARKDLRDNVHTQVQQSIAKGAVLVMGGTVPSHQGFYYPPTLLTNISKGMPAYDDEIFGPVVAVIAANNEQDAIRIANETHYGLGAAVFTSNLTRGEQIATTQLQAGTCAVNVMVASDPRVPFGGLKESGYGRELSLEGIHEFVNIKTVHLACG